MSIGLPVHRRTSSRERRCAALHSLGVRWARWKRASPRPSAQLLAGGRLLSARCSHDDRNHLAACPALLSGGGVCLRQCRQPPALVLLPHATMCASKLSSRQSSLTCLHSTPHLLSARPCRPARGPSRHFLRLTVCSSHQEAWSIAAPPPLPPQYDPLYDDPPPR